MYLVDTKYDEKKNPIMTTLYELSWGGGKKVILSVDGWKNTDDMIKIAREKKLLTK